MYACSDYLRQPLRTHIPTGTRRSEALTLTEWWLVLRRWRSLDWWILFNFQIAEISIKHPNRLSPTKVLCTYTHDNMTKNCVLFGTPFVNFQSHIFCAEEGECILLHVAWKHPRRHHVTRKSWRPFLLHCELEFFFIYFLFKANPIQSQNGKLKKSIQIQSVWPWFKQSSNRFGDVLSCEACEAMRQWPTTLLVLIQHQINGRR